MIAWNFQRIVGTCQFRVPWFGYPCGYSSLTKYQVADAGYGSYNNYLYCEEHGMEKHMKFPMYKKATTDES